MSEQNDNKKKSPEPVQHSMFDVPAKMLSSKRKALPEGPMKLTLESSLKARLQQGIDIQHPIVGSIPTLILPNRWEHLQPKIEGRKVAVRTVIRPVEKAMTIIRNIISYLETTGGSQVLVMRADSGSGKTTFLNTLPDYMPDIRFNKQVIELENVEVDNFNAELLSRETLSDGINLFILEGREKPESVNERYVQVVLSNINRFARSRRVPIIFVIPTTDSNVARLWCEQGATIGDLIPEGKLYEGSRWYEFIGVIKDQYTEITKETVEALNPNRTLYDYISPDEVKELVKTTSTIGRYMEVIATQVSSRREQTRIVSRGRREHVWIVYCSPDLRHRDHTYQVVDRLCQDEYLVVSPIKLIPESSNTPIERNWRQPEEWAKLVAAIRFLDIRLVNLSVVTLVTATLTYGDDELINSFKKAKLEDYRTEIEREFGKLDLPWQDPLIERAQKEENARISMEGSNLYALLRGTPADSQRGSDTDNAKVYARYLHLRKFVGSEISKLHYFVGLTLENLLKYSQFPGFVGVETEEPLIPGQVEPKPDISIHTETDVYALELHFTRDQITPSEVRRYALERVIPKYIRSISYISSQLDR
jgi:hypothetical protein